MGLSETKVEETLRKLRGRLAHSKQCAPYLVFGDRELYELLEQRPKTVKALSKIKGFPEGGKRVEKWGEAIVAIFNNPKADMEFTIEDSSDGEPKVSYSLKNMSSF